jgi:predicted N-acyltransferase
MPRALVMFLAEFEGRPVAGALCLRGGDTLYGRYWGADATLPGLHFETCYYQGIDYCIRHGLQRFEPGAQGEHKLARGFEPTATWSAFWIADARMREAVADFLTREDAALRDYAAETATHLPFKQTTTTAD